MHVTSEQHLRDDLLERDFTLDVLLALPGIGGPVGYSGGVISIGIRLALVEPRVVAAVLFAGSVVPRTMLEEARQVTIPLHVLLQWDDEGNDRQMAIALFDALGSREKSLHANMGGHTGVPAHAGEGADGFLARHLSPPPAGSGAATALTPASTRSPSGGHPALADPLAQPFRRTAATTRARTSASGSSSPSGTSSARTLLLSRRALNVPAGSSSDAPFGNVSRTLPLSISPMQTIPFADHTGTPSGLDGFFHFTSSAMDGSAARTTSRSRDNSSPRPSPAARRISSTSADLRPMTSTSFLRRGPDPERPDVTRGTVPAAGSPAPGRRLRPRRGGPQRVQPCW